jgi:alanine racemase
VGPIVAGCPEVAGLACTRVSEALALRGAGVRKPILNMAETSEEEIAELARHEVWPSVWLDDARERLLRAANKVKKRVAVHAFIDTGMNREGMPDYRARTWLEGLAREKSIEIAGTYMMFNHDLEADRQQYARFQRFTTEARQAGLSIGRLHGSPSFEVLHLPEARFDLVRPGNLLFGNFGSPSEVQNPPDLRPVFRLCARIARLEQLRPGETASFARGGYVAKAPTWIAMLPTGHTDGYPATAGNTCSVLVRGRLFPVVSVVASAHVILESVPRRPEVGDVATLIGLNDPDHTHAIAEDGRRLSLIAGPGPFLARRVV